MFCLITIWADEEIQSLLESSRRNASIYERISREMEEAGYSRNPNQCKEKIRKLKTKYKKLKDGHDVSGNNRDNWPFYDRMDRVLGSRHSVQPPTIIDTSDGGLRNNDGNDSEEESTQDQPSPVLFSTPHTSTPQILDHTSSSDAPTTSNPTPVVANRTVSPTTDPISISINPSVASLPTISSTSSRKRQKGKSPNKVKTLRSKSRKVDVLDKAMERIAKLQEESDERFLAMEEKRLQIERQMMMTFQGTLAFLQQNLASSRGIPAYHGGFISPGQMQPPNPPHVLPLPNQLPLPPMPPSSIPAHPRHPTEEDSD